MWGFDYRLDLRTKAKNPKAHLIVFFQKDGPI
jgi:hypothetical protein